jgi:Pyruvate/2-oxoacid:ferredoxin oxidoreductase delta subunit
MSAPAPSLLQLALRQGAGGQPLAPADQCALLSALLDNGYTVTVAVERQAGFAEGAPCLRLGVSLPASRPESVAPPDPPTARLVDITGWPIARVTALLEATRADLNAPKPGQWQPWFPVIDYDRCTNCLQCLSFCLFGVYGADAQRRIRVERSQNCKNNCPACARVCPEAAIIFPKYKAGPISGGEPSAAALRREKMKIDISALLGGDIYSLLRERSQRAKARFSSERDPDTALQERLRCLRQLAQTHDLPPEVLAALPAPADLPPPAADANGNSTATATP